MCGAEITQEDVEYCPHCGHRIKTDIIPKISKLETKETILKIFKDTPKITMVIILICIIVSIALLSYAFISTSSMKPSHTYPYPTIIQSNSPTQLTPVKNPTNSLTTLPTTSSMQFSDNLKQQLQKVVIGGDVTEVYYNPDIKSVVIWLNCEGWDAKSTRTAYADSTFEIMSVLTKYPDIIDTITIAGKTPMVDTKGQEGLIKVFQVRTTMADAKTVNWKNLYGFDINDALNSNFESVWWHPAIAP